MAVNQPKLAPFTTIQYVTKDGEKCTATKDNGIVTVNGDKNGVRQMPLDKFMKDLAENLPKVDLQKTPAKDTVSFSSNNQSNPVKKDNTLRNVAIAVGTALVGAGIWALTRGKAKDALGHAVKPDDIVETAKDAVHSAASKAQDVISNVVPKPAAAQDVASNAAAQVTNNAGSFPPVIPFVERQHEVVDNAARTADSLAEPPKNRLQDVLNSIFGQKEEAGSALTKVDNGVSASVKQADSNLAKLDDSVEASIRQMDDDVEKNLRELRESAEKQRRRDTEQQVADDAMTAALLADDAFLHSGRNAAKAGSEILEDLPKPSSVIDDITSTIDDIKIGSADDFGSGLSDGIGGLADDFGSGFSDSIGGLADDFGSGFSDSIGGGIIDDIVDGFTDIF